jgi:hypothetical protein
VQINGRQQRAIIDTGAANSVVSESAARRLGLQILAGRGAVSSGGVSELPARFAAAATLRFGGTLFHHVPFIVLPDAALSFPGDGGPPQQLDAIVGLPILRRLGRIEVRAVAGGERLQVRPATRRRSRESNLRLAGTLPIVVVHVSGAGRPLRMALDTGANRSFLAPGAIAAFPALAAKATSGPSKSASAGSLISAAAAPIITHLDLQVGDRSVGLSRVPVGPGPEICDGTLGQDVLRSGSGYVIDFDAMQVELLP